MQTSLKIQNYFGEIKEKISKAYSAAEKARKKGLDPQPVIEVALAENMAERVVGIISVVAPQLANSQVVGRIIELEKEYGALDWRVALKIAEEVAMEKFCKFETKLEAMEVGVRTGLAYVTVGVVSSPLDGLVNIELKKRMDNRGEYFCISFAGPIRNAGGTAAAVSVIIADYVRMKMGYDVYDATEDEIKRANAELLDYHERVANLQYFPSEKEIAFLLRNLSVEVGGEPSEKIEVSNYKHLPRTKTPFIRSGYCLVLSAGLSLKAPKLWKQLAVWGKDFGMEHWGWLEEFIKLQKQMKAKGQNEARQTGLKPDYTYIADLVAGRPVLGYPLRHGAFRLRYGRSRSSGYSSHAVHPATLTLLDNYIAIGTQLKMERPTKATTLSSCDTIEGPIVKLDDDSVVIVDTEAQAKKLIGRIKEILFMGDMLICYGDFFNRAHPLVKPGYCEEWWVQEVEKAAVNIFGTIDYYKIAELVGMPQVFVEHLMKTPWNNHPNAKQAIEFSDKFKVPLHSRYTYHWKDITRAQIIDLMNWLCAANISSVESIEIPYNKEKDSDKKRILEILGIPHSVEDNFAVIENDWARAFFYSFGLDKKEIAEQLKKICESQSTDSLELVNLVSSVTLRDKSGTYIGSRMGRPEKAKPRKLIGSPHCIFPVGEEGGKMRTMQSAVEIGKVTSEFQIFMCDSCNKEVIFRMCPFCGKEARKLHYCAGCGKNIETKECARHIKFWCSHCKRESDTKKCESCAGECQRRFAKDYKITTVDIKQLFDIVTKRIGMVSYPDIIKGVRGTSNATHVPERIEKGILRAKHGINVNKDGTVRYDCSELTLTHFKPKEIGTSIDKLKKLGYVQDIHSKHLENDDQILELLPQDVVLPNCPDSQNEQANDFMFKTAAFVDDLLVKFYNLPPYYNLSSKEDLIGHLIVALAPHTSAGVAGRVIGFSKTQCFLAHPYFHAANRRDCDGDELGFMMMMDALLNFSREFLPKSRGGTMDAPLVLTSKIIPTEVDDMAFDVDIVWNYPLEFYEAALQSKMPWEIKINQLKNLLNTPNQFENTGFTHGTNDINAGVLYSAYKSLPSMEEKLKGQMELAIKIRAVDAADVARLVIEKHFIKDTKGNLRKFSTQEFRCVTCNTKYRRPPLAGKCTTPGCAGRIIFTVSEGSVVKYLEPTLSLIRKYSVSPYLKQSIELLQMRVESVFGKDKEKQAGLGAWFG
jgi:DNA polymerase II large subunit